MTKIMLAQSFKIYYMDYWLGSRDLAVFITGMPLISFDSIVSSCSAFIVK